MKSFKLTFLPSVKNEFSNDPLIENWVKQLTDSYDFIKVEYPSNKDEAILHLRDSDAVYGVLTEDLLLQCKNLKWLQAPQAAPPPDYYYQKLIDHPVIVTNFRGIYNDHISHHIMSMILSFSRSLNIYIKQQDKANWSPIDNSNGATRYLPECKVLMIGVGGIGSETARLCDLFGMTVIGVDSRLSKAPNYLSKLVTPSQLDGFIYEADFIVSTVPHTPETEGQFDMNFFKKMKKTAFFINIGRGMTTKLNDLVNALEAEEISGAGLDVYEIEPLPKSHALWKFDNVILTPHVAAFDVPYLDERRFEVIADNCKLFSSGKELKNIVDKKLWF